MQTTLCFCLTDTHILLAMKKRGFGAGKWNGYGGKMQPGETAKAGVVREILEESGLTVEEGNLTPVAFMDFYFAGVLRVSCEVFVTSEFSGLPYETEEMKPEWFPLTEIPYEEMWAADQKWVPLILAGTCIKARVDFDDSGDTVIDFSFEETTLP